MIRFRMSFGFLFMIILTCFLGILLAFVLFQWSVLDWVPSFWKQLPALVSEMQKENEILSKTNRILSEQVLFLEKSIQLHQNQMDYLNQKLNEFEIQQRAILEMYYQPKPGRISPSFSNRVFLSSFSSKMYQLMKETHSIPMPSSWLRIKP